MLPRNTFNNIINTSVICPVTNDKVIWTNGLELKSTNSLLQNQLTINGVFHSNIIKDICKINDNTIATVVGKTINICEFRMDGNIASTNKLTHTHDIIKICLFTINSILILSKDKILRCVSIRTGDVTSNIATGHVGDVLGLCKVDIDNATAATSSSDGIIRIWNMQTGVMQRELAGHTASVNDICLLKLNHIVSASNDRTLRVWRVSDGVCTQVLQGHIGLVNTVCVLNCGLFASGSNDGTIKIWNSNIDIPIGDFAAHGNRINRIGLFNNTNIVSAGIDKTIKVWNISISNDSIYDYLIASEQIDTAFLLACKENNGDRILELLFNDRLFIDCYDDDGMNGLMHLIEARNDIYFGNLLEKGININAIDINGDTALHHAVRLPGNRNIVTLLCQRPDIVVNIQNNRGQTPISIGRVYEDIIAPIAVAGDENVLMRSCLTRPWNGLTLQQINEWFDLTSIDKDKNGDDIFNTSAFDDGLDGKKHIIICPGCLERLERAPGGCSVLREHNCHFQKDDDIYKGKPGMPSYINEEIIHREVTHQEPIAANPCIECGTVCDFEEEWPKNRGNLPVRLHNYYVCNYKNGYKLKYYRYKRMIEKIFELQKRIGEQGLTFKNAMDQIINAGVNIIPFNCEFNNNIIPPIDAVTRASVPAGIECVTQAQIDAVYNDIIARKTFLPPGNLAILFPRKPNGEPQTIRDVYPIDMRCVGGRMIPNMRHPRDVIENDLMPSIIDNTEQQYDPDSFDIPDKLVKFRHRQHTDLQIKDEAPDYYSIPSFIERFKIISDPTHDLFGKCYLYNIKECKSYLYPDELKLFVNKGHIHPDHQYVIYRKNFSNSNRIIYNNIPVYQIQLIKKMFIIPDNYLNGNGGNPGGGPAVGGGGGGP
jgi:hypothetical protein